MRDEYGLTPRQRAFCDEYLKCGNASEAARRVGYSEKSAFRAGIDNMQKPKLKNYIAERLQSTQEKRIADADEVLLYLSRVMRGEIKDAFGLDASLQDRTKAAQELLKRWAVADQRQSSTLARLDSMLMELRIAVDAPPAEGMPPGGKAEPGSESSEGKAEPVQAPEPSEGGAGAIAEGKPEPPEPGPSGAV